MCTFVFYTASDAVSLEKTPLLCIFFCFYLHNPKISCNFAAQSFCMTAETAKNIVPIIRRYFETQPVEKAWLFGSFARGEETPKSDVDILVKLDFSQPIGLQYFGMICDLEEQLGRKVDLVSEGTLRPMAAKSAEQDKFVIYERSSSCYQKSRTN